MNEHVEQWIGAYLDGELNVDRRERLEAHLSACPACRQELQFARGLSSWLRSAALPESLPDGDEFVTRLAPHLPERPAPAPPWTAPGLVWWLIPLAILSGWLAFQLLYLAEEWLRALAPLSLTNAVLTWLTPDLFISLWLDLATTSLQPMLGQGFQAWLVTSASLWQGALLQIGLNAIAAVLFISWLAGLAARRIHLAAHPV